MKQLLALCCFLLLIFSLSYANVIVDKTTIVRHKICGNINLTQLTTIYKNSDMENIQWFNNEEFIGAGTSVIVPTKDSCEYYALCGLKKQEENLLSNGDFEQTYAAFTSEAITSNALIPNPLNFKKNYANGDIGKYYAVSTNASKYDATFYPLRAHSGTFFILFDVTNDRNAWIVSTNNNPNLSIIKDSTYTLSFWYANPNMLQDTTNLATILCELLDENNTTLTTLTPKEGIPVSVNNNQWQFFSHTWKATTTASISLRIKNLSSTKEGGDFCLDDIRFSTLTSHYAYKERHLISTKKCEEDQEEEEIEIEEPKECTDSIVFAKWDNMLFVDKGTRGRIIMGDEPIAFQWFKDDMPIEGETGQIYYNPNGMTGNYYVRITLQNGNIIKSCEQSFAEIERSANFNPGKNNQPRKTQKLLYSIGKLYIECLIDENGQNQISKKFVP